MPFNDISRHLSVNTSQGKDISSFFPLRHLLRKYLSFYQRPTPSLVLWLTSLPHLPRRGLSFHQHLNVTTDPISPLLQQTLPHQASFPSPLLSWLALYFHRWIIHCLISWSLFNPPRDWDKHLRQWIILLLYERKRGRKKERERRKEGKEA